MTVSNISGVNVDVWTIRCKVLWCKTKQKSNKRRKRGGAGRSESRWEREHSALVVGLLSYGSVRPKCSESGWLLQSHSSDSLVDKWKNTVVHNHTCIRLVMSGRGRHTLLLKSQCLVIVRSLVWFLGCACQSVLWQNTEPTPAPDVLVGTLHGSHHHQCRNIHNTYIIIHNT